ncbi:hypothetical protein GOODEAATRI_023858 [Goodea atripinnis]|uniref:YTH domain-containing family protein n=1 Tax=Goodea atripinnis TaxID=208336 RepID=A0ABV0PGU8_9TELE
MTMIPGARQEILALPPRSVSLMASPTSKLRYILQDARFFLIKSNNHENVSLAKAKVCSCSPNLFRFPHFIRWRAPYVPNPLSPVGPLFFLLGSPVVLLLFPVIFPGSRLQAFCPSVLVLWNCSFARLSSESHHGGSPIHWVLPAGMNAKMLGGVFKIDWLCRRELPFLKTAHLSNPWNDHKPVKIGRDGQVSFFWFRSSALSSVPCSHWTRAWMFTTWLVAFVTSIRPRQSYGLEADRRSANREG